MKSIAIIPARYASSRFPGKPLADLGGKPVIEWVYTSVRAIDAFDDVVVATDDTRIADAVNDFGGKCMMTRPDHKSGTERCGEVVELLASQGLQFDVVVNVQGDEPFVNSDQIISLLSAFDHPDASIVTLVKKITSADELHSCNNVKVTADLHRKAMYFSRTPIPFIRDCNPSQWHLQHDFYKHVGIYAYRSATLMELVHLQETSLEQCEKLEQLRWLECGYPIYLIETFSENVGIDTPDDLIMAREMLKPGRRILDSPQP